MSVLNVHLLNTTDNFVAGKIHACSQQWKKLSSDKWIHDVVQGSILDFVGLPLQETLPRPLTLSVADTLALDCAILKFQKHRIVEKCMDVEGQGFFSNIFPVIKADGTARVILNLKVLNEYITHVHFKMESVSDVLNLVQHNCYFMSVDFKDAYFSIYVKPSDRKWLKFMWKDQAFQFTCLPQGLTSAPRIFTKLLKPVLSHLRKLGITMLCYIDDCLFVASSVAELCNNVTYALKLFDTLGLTINVHKSVLTPTQEIEFLGIIWNSVSMTATLPIRRRDRIRQQGKSLLKGDITLRDLASFVGLAVASTPAVPLAPLRYKYLEIIRNKELACNNGNYDVPIFLDEHAKDLVRWWIHHIDSQSNSLLTSPPQLDLYTDASMTGWGAVFGNSKTGGHWAQDEIKHINHLELKAIFMGLQSLCGHCVDAHICLHSDNTTAVSCINRCGSTKPNLNTMTERIFAWAQSRGISLSSEYVKSVHNVEADKESRIKNLDTEWMLAPHIFKRLCEVFYIPDMDLFASRINAQLPTYVSWKPDPTATYINAFTLNWGNRNPYAFPPFSIIGRVLRKLQEDKATLLTILPLWPTQVWFPKALQLLAAPPLLLPRKSLILPQSPDCTHPQAHNLVLTAMLLSGNPLKTEAFRQQLPNFYFSHGDQTQNFNMGHISKDGCHFVSAEKVILFNHL